MGDGGSVDGGGRIGTWSFDIVPCSVFLCRRWTCRVDSNGEAAEGDLRPHRPLQPSWPPDEYAEDSEHGMPAMPHTWHHVGGAI